jgi:hypothetical protein
MRPRRKTLAVPVPEAVAPNKPTRGNSFFSTLSFNELHRWYMRGKGPSEENFGPLQEESEHGSDVVGNDFYYNKDDQVAPMEHQDSTESPLQF